MKEIVLKPNWEAIRKADVPLLLPKMMKDGLHWYEAHYDWEQMKSVYTIKTEVAVSVSDELHDALTRLLRECHIESEFDSFMAMVHYGNYEYGSQIQKFRMKTNEGFKQALSAYVGLLTSDVYQIIVKANGKRIALNSFIEEETRLALIGLLENQLDFYQKTIRNSGLYISINDDSGKICLDKAKSHLATLKYSGRPIKNTDEIKAFAKGIYNFLPRDEFNSKNKKLEFVGKFFTDIVPVFLENKPTYYTDLGKLLLSKSSKEVY